MSKYRNLSVRFKVLELANACAGFTHSTGRQPRSMAEAIHYWLAQSLFDLNFFNTNAEAEEYLSLNYPKALSEPQPFNAKLDLRDTPRVIVQNLTNNSFAPPDVEIDETFDEEKELEDLFALEVEAAARDIIASEEADLLSKIRRPHKSPEKVVEHIDLRPTTPPWEKMQKVSAEEALRRYPQAESFKTDNVYMMAVRCALAVSPKGADPAGLIQETYRNFFEWQETYGG